MSNRHRWDWESCLTPEETAQLSALWREADEIRQRLDDIKLAEADIKRLATIRAKSGRKVRKVMVAE